VATEIIARYNANELDIEIEQLILTNGSIHIELSQLRTIQKLLKHKFFRKNMKNIYFDSSKVTDFELKEMWELIELNGGRKVIHKLTLFGLKTILLQFLLLLNYSEKKFQIIHYFGWKIQDIF